MKSDLKLRSNSKINLGLWIKEKRPDNYHEIETIFYENNDLYDEVEIKIENSKNEKESSLDVSFIQKELSDTILLKKNLAYKAARLFFDKLGVKVNCNITINKMIPLEAGLGGGSSNAACVLKGLNQMFDHKLHNTELLTIASQIGSDVPFFILGKTCFGKGKGEILTPLENSLKLEIKVVKPENIAISTKWAYEQIDNREFISDHKTDINNLILAMKKGDSDLFFKNTFNDFEMVAFSYYPQLVKERKKLLDEGYKTIHLCGSGSAIFGIKELSIR